MGQPKCKSCRRGFGLIYVWSLLAIICLCLVTSSISYFCLFSIAISCELVSVLSQGPGRTITSVQALVARHRKFKAMHSVRQLNNVVKEVARHRMLSTWLELRDSSQRWRWRSNLERGLRTAWKLGLRWHIALYFGNRTSVVWLLALVYAFFRRRLKPLDHVFD